MFTTTKKLYLYTLGCKVNWCDSEDIAAAAGLKGWSRVNNARDAVVCVVNTCTVTAHADATARKTIRRIRRDNPRAALVVAGCYARTDADELAAMSEVDKVATSASAAGIVATIEDAAAEVHKVRFAGTAARGDVAGRLSPSSARKLGRPSARTRAFIKVQDGCDRFCAYCKVPYARGKPRSVPMADVLKQVERAAHRGNKEIVLTGINLAAYEDDSNRLVDLLAAVAAQGMIPRIRVSSVEANAVDKQFCELFADSKSLMPHVHVPMQSASDRVLKLMNRQVSAAEFMDAVLRFLDTVPLAAVSTDILVGLPGETEVDFEQTLHVVDSIPFAKVHVFHFSPRPGTAAAKMKSLFVKPADIKRREITLIEHAHAAAQRCRDIFSKTKFDVLVEYKKQGRWEGFSQNYLRVQTTREDVEKNEIVALDLNNQCNMFAPVQ